jgi:hypothetical protein
MQQTLWEIACDYKGYRYSEIAIGPEDSAVVVCWSETSEERRAKPNLTVSKINKLRVFNRSE